MSCNVQGILDRAGKESFDASGSSGNQPVSTTIPGQFTVSLGAIGTAGTYYYAARVNAYYGNSYVLTDTSDYSATQYITVIDRFPLTIDVNNDPDGSLAVPDTYGRIELWNSSGTRHATSGLM